MTTVNRTIESEHDKDMATKLIEARTVPFTLTLTDGKHRTTAQNRLQRLWINEISAQRGDLTPEEARGYCKLTIGVPLLREENEAFAKEYDEVVKPLPYEAKLKLMMIPFDFGVTRLMTSKQKTVYLDRIAQHFGEQGIVLTMPEDMKQPEPGASPSAPADDEPTPPARRQEDAAEFTQPSPTAAASSPLFEEPELSSLDRSQLIECYSKLIGISKTEDIDVKTKRDILEGAKNEWKVKLRTGLHSHLVSMVLSADGVIKGADRGRAIAEYAYFLGCTPEELGGCSDG